MNTETAATVAAIEAKLARLGWLCTDDTPCYYAVDADDDLPEGWVRVYDDTVEGYGPADEVLANLRAVSADDDYGTGCPTGEQPDNSRDWPEELFTTEQLEEGTLNDEPNTLITLRTNGGTRYVAGPHGAYNCALFNWFHTGERFAKNREYAISSGCELCE